MNEITQDPPAEPSKEATWWAATASATGAVASRLKGLSQGERAELRRMGDGLPPAFWSVAYDELEPRAAFHGPLPQEEMERRWGFAVQLIARMEGLHDYTARTGEVLGREVGGPAGERRFQKLLRAHDATLRKELLAVTHRLRASRVRVDLTGLVALVLSDGDVREEDGVRLRLARDYYRIHHAKKTT